MSNDKPILLITGGAKRIGKEICRAMAKDGWHIAMHYNSSNDEAIKLQSELQSFGATVTIHQADLSNENETTNLITECSEQLGTPTLLINNASIFENDDIKTFTTTQFDTHMAINLRAPLLLSQEFAKKLGRETKGNIINLTDQRTQNLNPTFFTYTLSKSGLSSATTTMAQALAPNIRVNAIAPGPVLQSIHQTEEEFNNECKGTLLGHGTTTTEIIEAIKFLLNASSITGETINLDGGQRLSWQ